jgi:hypothetical protein
MDGFFGFECCFSLGVVEPNLTACLRCDLGDATAHGTRANDGNLFENGCHKEKFKIEKTFILQRELSKR